MTGNIQLSHSVSSNIAIMYELIDFNHFNIIIIDNWIKLYLFNPVTTARSVIDKVQLSILILQVVLSFPYYSSQLWFPSEDHNMPHKLKHTYYHTYSLSIQYLFLENQVTTIHKQWTGITCQYFEKIWLIQ